MFTSNIAPETKAEAKRLYEASMDSCNRIAKKLGIESATVQTWVRRCGWVRPGAPTREVKEYKAKLQNKVEAKLENSSARLSDRATALIERTLSEAEEWLNLLAEKRRKGAMDAEDCLRLISAWKIPIEMSRRALRLDDVAPNQRVGLFLPVQIVTTPMQNIAPGAIIDVTATDATSATGEIPQVATLGDGTTEIGNGTQ